MRRFNWLTVVFIAALLIRFIALDQSLWLDEAVVANNVQSFSYQGLITRFAPSDFHPPLYYLLTKGWVSLFGASEIVLRMPSVIFSLLTGALVASLGGIWAGALLLFNPLFIYYSQEARMYALATFLLTLTYWSIQKKRWVLVVMASLLAFCSFYGSIFFLASFALSQLIVKNKRGFWSITIGTTLGLLVCSPLLYQQLQTAVLLRSLVPNWSSVLGPASVKNLLLIFIKFTSGRLSFEPKWLYYLLAGGFSLVVWGVVASTFRQKKNWRDGILLVGPIVLGLVFSLFTPLLSYFRFLYLLPILSLLISRFKVAWVKWLILIGFISWSLVYLIFPQFHREDWRSLSAALPKNAQVLGIPSSLEPIKYYQSNLKIIDYRTAGFTANHYLVVPYTWEIYGLNSERLQKAGYHLSRQQSFRQLVLESWVK